MMAGFVIFTLIFGLVVGRQALDQKRQTSPEPEPSLEEVKPPAVTGELPDPRLPRVSSQARPKGWVDLKSDDLRKFMSLPGMTRARAIGILELRKSNPDLKLQDLLAVPGISPADLDAWREFIWEGS